MNLRPARLLHLLVAGLAAALLLPTGAGGAPIDDLRAQASALTADIEENGARVAALGEQLNAAQIRFDEAEAKIADSRARIADAQARIRDLKALIANRAASVYRTAGTTGPLEAIDVEDAGDAGTRSKYTEAAAARDEQLVDELDRAREDLEHERAAAERVRESAAEERDDLAAAKADANAAAAEQQGLLDQVNGEIAQLVAEEQARRAAAAAAAAPRTGGGSGGGGGGGSGGGGGGGGGSGGPLGPPHPGAGAAVSYAWAQVGKPYCYAGTGPSCYDCSGLTMMAWAQGGVSMPHYSGAQGSMFPAVPLSQLQPGDLITTTSWSAHVGIWVGGGYVHATHTGDFIKFVSGSGSVSAAVRPG